MKKFFALLLVGFFGYVTYPIFYPKLSSEPMVKEEINSELLDEQLIKPEEVAKIPDEPVIEEKPEPQKIASHKMGVKEELPEILDEPEKEVVNQVPKLDETDIKIIITNAVEAGGRIDFRKDNIISWELKDQALSLQGSEYVGEIGIEVGTLFGPELRRVKVVIKDEKIISWEWLAVDAKE